jgi:hypothetical protein
MAPFIKIFTRWRNIQLTDLRWSGTKQMGEHGHQPLLVFSLFPRVLCETGPQNRSSLIVFPDFPQRPTILLTDIISFISPLLENYVFKCLLFCLRSPYSYWLA